MNALARTYLRRGIAGLKPQRRFHLGNYFGTLRKVIDAQEKYPGENFLFVADLHGLIHSGGREIPRSHVYRLVKQCLCLGIDPARTCIYLQSEIPELMHFMWRLACTSPKLAPTLGSATRRPFEDLYDTLMAADILGLRASIVNVGGDLDRSLVVCGRLATSMNTSREASVLPSPLRAPGGSSFVDHVPGCDGQRMSYSAGNYVPIIEENTGEADEAIDGILTGASIRPSASGGTGSDDIAGRLLTLFRGQAHTDGATLADQIAELKRAVRDEFSNARRAWSDQRIGDREVDDLLEAGRVRVRAEYRETMRELGF